VILLCGATGDLGGRIARLLAERGLSVRALVRPSADASALEALGLEVVRGDFRDPASLARATEGAETVVTGVTAIGRMLAGSEGRDGLRAVDERGTIALVDAAERAGAARFVYVSAAGADESPEVPIMRAKLAVEERLRASPLREAIVRPSAYFEIWLTPASQLDWNKGVLSIFGKGEARSAYVATEDAAEAVARLTVAADPPRVVTFGGPEAMTRNEVADLIEQAVGRPMKRRHLPRPVLRIARRALAPLKPELASLMGLGLAMDLRDEPWDEGPLRELGIEPARASDFIREAVAAG
jgi:uncharacterized protein YbjT (DUF2867 family)